MFYAFLFFNLSLILGVTSSPLADGRNFYGNDKPHVTKCCHNDEIVKAGGGAKSCVPHEDVLDYSTIPVYSIGLEPTRKLIGVDIPAAKFWDLSDKRALNLKVLPELNHYLTEEGKLYVESPNDYKRWYVFNNTEYCFDFVTTGVSKETSLTPNWWVVFDENTPPMKEHLWITPAAMLVSSFFLALVFVVYVFLPPLQNLSGLIVMAYVLSQSGAYLSLGILQILKLLEQNTAYICLRLSPVIYFFFLTAFCWMNVMSFDVWYSLRGHGKQQMMQRQCRNKFKFGVYCAYAYGVPGAMTAMLVTLMHADMTRWPWFITPAIPRKGCFLEHGELFLYLYVPMLILIISNWILFVMTIFSIRRLSSIANEERNHRLYKQKFMVYFKLSIVMGITWITEVISALKPDFIIWRFTDFYNSLLACEPPENERSSPPMDTRNRCHLCIAGLLSKNRISDVRGGGVMKGEWADGGRARLSMGVYAIGILTGWTKRHTGAATLHLHSVKV
ncbi:G-protein coupled receptor Mth2 [Eumeta japonica]|uniref:G-protein coupled receptor Mth2 n=1 Tax=Eumeta variegata TaxID=151549 RepID=A0A4C1W7J4_EUMVA|nr:G-protein coupled receptor Mth2 [Eumeta japonica]